MANNIGWGQGVINNAIGWGQGAINNAINWGKSYFTSYAGETDIIGSQEVDLLANLISRVAADGGTFVNEACLNTTLTYLDVDAPTPPVVVYSHILQSCCYYGIPDQIVYTTSQVIVEGSILYYDFALTQRFDAPYSSYVVGGCISDIADGIFVNSYGVVLSTSYGINCSSSD